MSDSLVEKLAAAALAIPELSKLGQNDDYSYLRAYDVTRAVRGELFKRGIVILPESLTVEYVNPYMTATGDMMEEARVSVVYKLTDGEEHLHIEGLGVGQDYKGKALYKAMTGSLKYALMCVGLIAGVEDDPETTSDGPVSESLAEKLDEAEKKFGPDLREHPISQRDVRAFTSACKAANITPHFQKKYLRDFYGVEKISDVKRKDAAKVIQWAVAQIPAGTSIPVEEIVDAGPNDAA